MHRRAARAALDAPQRTHMPSRLRAVGYPAGLRWALHFQTCVDEGDRRVVWIAPAIDCSDATYT
jgi:hypothetical protein